MTILPGLAAELGLLTQALDVPGTDVAETVIRLAADTHSAVDSYVGLSVMITANRCQFDVTVLDEGTQPEHVRTSLLVPLSDAPQEATALVSVVLILYAATPGAFIDLAADLSWIAGRALADFRLDEHRTLPSNYANSTHLGATSKINQALGVLIGQGLTPAEAERSLYERAATVGIDLVGAATLILAALTPRGAEQRP